MKHITKKILYTNKSDITDALFHEDCIFFDIETTGFSPASCQLYLIGCLYKKDTDIIIEQFFAESPADEKDVLLHFMELLNRYTTIFSFNGLGFDLPFIKAKCKVLGISNDFHAPASRRLKNGQTEDYQIEEHHTEEHHIKTLDYWDNFQYIDIFKEINRIKPLLLLPNYKQKTIETFLGIKRDDKYTGGELISVYKEYVRTQDPIAEELLLLHNFDDVAGMLDLLPILSYVQILNGAYEIEHAETNPYTTYERTDGLELILTLKNHCTVPKRISCAIKDYYLVMHNDITKIRIPIYEGELKYFYPNHKDYFYLPIEDMAIHKSVASFVDKEFREKAKASNCYTRKMGRFLPQYETFINPFFKKEYKDKISYFELTDEFMESNEMLQQYVEHVFAYMTKRKAFSPEK